MNPPINVVVPPTVVTTTFCEPTVPAGVTAVRDVPAPSTATLVAAAPPTVTVAPVKFVPVIVIGVAPSAEPVEGVTPAIVGSAT